MNTELHFSSATDDWATPQYLFDELNLKYGPFELDVCASAENHKCPAWFGLSKNVDGLTRDWTVVQSLDINGKETHVGRKCWMNPPYGRKINLWIKKAYEESLKGCTVVCLLPARTDTRYFHDYCMKGEIEFIRGRLKFGNAKNSAPFPSMIVVFRGKNG